MEHSYARGRSDNTAQEVCFRELCIFHEVPFCRSLNSSGGSEAGQRETQWWKMEGGRRGGSCSGDEAGMCHHYLDD